MLGAGYTAQGQYIPEAKELPITKQKIAAHIDESIAAADFDNDGLVDFITVAKQYINDDKYGQKSSLIYLYKLNENGDFELQHLPIAKIPTDLNRGISAVVADFNNDNYQDILFTAKRDGENTTSSKYLYINNGDGTFKNVTRVPLKENYDNK